MYIAVKTLPSHIQNVLAGSIGYGRKDIQVDPCETVSPGCGGGDGSRGFTILARLDNPEVKVMWGSWGGANMFNPGNAVDMDHGSYPIPPNGAVITGSVGGGRPAYAVIHVHPSIMPQMLPAGPVVNPFERKVLAVYGGIRGGCRTEYLEAIERKLGKPNGQTVSAAVDRLVSAGMLKRNKAGAIQITTEGKNARGSENYYC